MPKENRVMKTEKGRNKSPEKVTPSNIIVKGFENQTDAILKQIDAGKDEGK